MPYIGDQCTVTDGTIVMDGMSMLVLGVLGCGSKFHIMENAPAYKAIANYISVLI